MTWTRAKTRIGDERTLAEVNRRGAVVFSANWRALGPFRQAYCWIFGQKRSIEPRIMVLLTVWHGGAPIMKSHGKFQLRNEEIGR